MWALAGRKMARKVRTDIQSKNFMPKIMWYAHRFHIIDRLSTWGKMNSGYYATNILQPLRQAFFPRGKNPGGKRLVVDIDNCSVHRSAMTESFMKIRDMISMAHPPYSPNRAPNNFSLFATVKERLENYE
jgi:hypothetical protein